MNISDRKAFVCAVAIHVLLFGAILFFAWRGTSRAEAQPMVMEILPPPGDAQQDSFAAPPADSPLSDPAPAAEAAPAEPLLQQPDIAPAAEQTFDALSDVPPAPPPPEPEPTPPPPVETPPAPTPTPAPRPTPQRTPPAQTPAQTTPAQPQVMTRDQFLQTSGLPRQARDNTQRRQTTTTTNRGTSTNAAPVRIDTSDITRSLNGLLAPSGSGARVSQMSASDQNALHAYLNRLRSNIRSAWVLPDSTTDQGEWAEVQLTVEADGRISSFRISRHQGSKAFLDSINKALRATRSAGPTPSRQREYVKYTLNLRDM